MKHARLRSALELAIYSAQDSGSGGAGHVPRAGGQPGERLAGKPCESDRLDIIRIHTQGRGTRNRRRLYPPCERGEQGAIMRAAPTDI